MLSGMGGRALLRIWTTAISFLLGALLVLNRDKTLEKLGLDQIFSNNLETVMSLMAVAFWILVGATVALWADTWLRNREHGALGAPSAANPHHGISPDDLTFHFQNFSDRVEIVLIVTFINTGRDPIQIEAASYSARIGEQTASPAQPILYSSRYVGPSQRTKIHLPKISVPDVTAATSGWLELKLVVGNPGEQPKAGMHIGCEFWFEDYRNQLAKQGVGDAEWVRHAFSQPFYGSADAVRAKPAIR